MVPTVAFPRGCLSKAARRPRGQPQLETSDSFAARSPCPCSSSGINAAASALRPVRTYCTPATSASATPIQSRTRGHAVPSSRHEDEAERRVQDPRRELAEEAHLEVEAARGEQPVAEDRARGRGRGRRAPPRCGMRPVAQRRTTAVPIMSRSASGSATLPKRTPHASGGRGTRRPGRSEPQPAKKMPAPHAGAVSSARGTARRRPGWPRSARS